MTTQLRRFSLLLTLVTALLIPGTAAASSHHPFHCRAGYHKATRGHRIVCVKNRTAKPAPTKTPVQPAPTPVIAPPTAPTTTTTTSPPPTTTPSAPTSGAPSAPPASGPPSRPATKDEQSATRVGNAISAASSGIGTPYAADVSCDGALSAFDFIPATETNHEAGYVDMSPAAVPAAGLSSQWVAAREWMYSWNLKRWIGATGWEEKVVTAPNPNIVEVGDTSGSPFRFNGEMGNQGYVYIDTQYYFWTGSQWAGGLYVGTSNYTQSYSATSRASGNSWCDLT